MLQSTTESLNGKSYEVLGIAQGTIVQTKHIGRDFLAAFKTIVGGEVKGYTDMIVEARKIATQRMIDEATKLGADAIVSVRFTTSNIMDGASEVMAYGTAVKTL